MLNTIVNKKNTVRSQFINTSIQKSPTGIKGFDEITFGGLPKNRPTLIVGGIGCGKTVLAIEYIVNGVEKFGENGVFMTFEEKTQELIENTSNQHFDISKLIKEKKILLEHLEIHHNIIKEAGTYKIDGLFTQLERAITLVNAKRVVLDSLDTLFNNLDLHIIRSEFKRLFSWLKEKKVTAIITAEIGDVFITRMGLEESIADCVIELNNRVTNQISTRRLRILKYRGSNHANNEYPFLINENGMSVFPIISQGLQQSVSSKRMATGIYDLDEMLEGKGFYWGSSILISGTAGTGKTSFIATFTKKVCESNLNCFFCAFEESPNQILRNMASIGIDLNSFFESKKLQFYFSRPSLQNLELHFLAIKEDIEKKTPHVIILDPITNLMTEGPNSDIRSMLTRFIDYLKTKQITVMFTAAITIGSIARNPSDEGISSMVDTWINLEDTESNGKRIRTLRIVKSRGMGHSRDFRNFDINNNGILLQPLSKENEKYCSIH